MGAPPVPSTLRENGGMHMRLRLLLTVLAVLCIVKVAETTLSAIKRALKRDPLRFTVSFTDPLAANQEALLKSNIVDLPCNEH